MRAAFALHRLFLTHCFKYHHRQRQRTTFVAKKTRLYLIHPPRGRFDKTTDCHITSVPTSDHRGCSIQHKVSEIVKGDGY